MYYVQLYFVLYSILKVAQGANIFVFFGSPFGSHRMAIWSLLEELAQRDHNITFFQSFSPTSELKLKGLTELVIETPNKVSLQPPDYLGWRLVYGKLVNLFIRSDTYRDYGVAACEMFLASSKGQKVITHGEFDIVIMDELASECGYAFAHIWNAKTIVFATVAPIGGSIEFMGIPDESATMADVRYPFMSPENFIQRLFSELLLLNNYAYRNWVYYPELENIVRRHLGKKFTQETTLAELAAKTSLRLTNNHYSIEGVRNNPPFNVYIGGAYLDAKRKPDAIPKALRDFMARGDFIYVSFGSIVAFTNITENLKAAFFDALESSGVNIILKYEGVRPATLSTKFYTSPWLPQFEVLSSTNCKGFISHGGIKSITEAIANGIPMILLPICCDQDYNAFNQKRLGRAQVLELSTLTIEELMQAIHEMLHNTEYKVRAIEAVQQFADRPMKPLDEAVYWTEYVIRHRDTAQLKSQAHTLYWFQRRLLDVWMFLLTLAFGFIWFLHTVSKKIIKYVNIRQTTGRKANEVKKNKKNT